MPLLPWRKLQAALSGEDDTDSFMNIVKHTTEVSTSIVETSGDYLPRSGGTMAGNIAMGSNKVTGSAAASANGDLVRYEQALLLTGGTMAGNIAMGTNKITGSGAATANGDLVRFEQLTKTLLFSVAGTLAVGLNVTFEIPAPEALTISKVYINVKTAPTGTSIIVDVNKGSPGTTIFTEQANRPEIAAGTKTDESGTPDVTALAKNDILSIDIDQVGSTIAGADLVVQVRCVVV